jgi:hypothetical protein
MEHESANKSRGSFLFMVFATLKEQQNHHWNEPNDGLAAFLQWAVKP